jgi:3D (Asp-Asp-Asp) domain-containing protein
LEHRDLLRFALGICAIFLLGACGTTRRLPAYEAPLAKVGFQTVRTTAYTHTESDHVEFSNHNALGGELHAAARPIRTAAVAPRALPVDADEESDYHRASLSETPLQPFSMTETTTVRRSGSAIKRTKTTTVTRYAVQPPGTYGSAAADWSRWPAGTIFRLLSTGQIYRIDDYGWALAGRNTIDLYMATPNEMNAWGARSEPIQILRWGDPQESLRFLQSRQGYRHLRRMVLELEGNHRAAAAME